MFAIVVHLDRLGMAMDFPAVVMVVLVTTVGVQMHVERRRCVDGQRQAHTKDQNQSEHLRPILADKALGSQIAATRTPD